ncbi:MAG: OmpA family protein [Flavobacteriales bacterium]|nr:OmpA family protein [Flavobacteriales bacterium]
MLRPTILSAALLLHCVLNAQDSGINNPVAAIINFETASCAIDVAAQEQLDAICDRIAQEGPVRVSVIGHTDRRGTIEYNIALSERRSEAVRAALAQCAPGVRFELAWQGEQSPLLPADESDDVVQNRRVEVAWERADVHGTEQDAPVPAAVFDALHRHPFVAPLMPMADKVREVHSVDPGQPISFMASDGVTVNIAANSIVDAKGKVVSGTVDISYRSFSEPYSIIASGIPMHLETAHGTEHFETAGMYELYASQNGQKLRLKPGANIELARPEQAALPEGFGPFVLKASTGEWETGGSLAQTIAPSAVAPSFQSMSRAVQVFLRKADDDLARKEPDSLLFDARRDAWNYCYVTKWDSADVSRRSWEKVSNPFRKLGGIPAIQLLPGSVQHYNRTGEILFNVWFADNKYHPEWRHLRRLQWWKYTGTEARKVFKQLYGRRHWYQDIELQATPGEDHAVLRVKEAGRWLELPVAVGYSAMSEAEAKRWDRDLAQYNATASNKEEHFDRATSTSHRRWATRRTRGIQKAYEAAQRFMTQREDSMSMDAFRAYASSFRTRFNNMDSTQRSAFASISTRFKLDDFGVYNIDRIMKMPEQQQVLASTTNSELEAFPWVTAYAVLEGENSVITYWGNSTGRGDNMLVARGRMRSLFLVDADGRIARASVEGLNSGNARCDVQWQLMEQPKTLAEMQAVASR